jgi:hypothetical protein
MKICIEKLPNGYRRASLHGAYGAVLIVRPDGSQCWTNVQPDSPLYAVLNDALFSKQEVQA